MKHEIFFQERIRPKRQQWWHVFTDVINRNSIIKDTAQLKAQYISLDSKTLNIYVWFMSFG